MHSSSFPHFWCHWTESLIDKLLHNNYSRGAAYIPGLGLTSFNSNHTDCNPFHVCHVHDASPRSAAQHTEWDWHCGGPQQIANTQWSTKVSEWVTRVECFHVVCIPWTQCTVYKLCLSACFSSQIKIMDCNKVFLMWDIPSNVSNLILIHIYNVTHIFHEDQIFIRFMKDWSFKNIKYVYRIMI